MADTNRKRLVKSPSTPEEPKKKARLGEGPHQPMTLRFDTTLGLPRTPHCLQSSLSLDPAVLGMPALSHYAPTYHYTALSQPAPRAHHIRRCGLKIGNVAFEDARLSLPPDTSLEDQQSIRLKCQSELQRQAENPPTLPRSQVPDLPPKSTIIEFHNVPDDATDQEKEIIRQRNCDLAKESQRIDRERNNQAAKKSRETRLEALHNTRLMLNDKAAECDWLRLKVIQLGGDPADWDTMDGLVKGRIVSKIAERVAVRDQIITEEKKREEQKKRAERNKMRMQIRESAASVSPMSPQAMLMGAHASEDTGQ